MPFIPHILSPGSAPWVGWTMLLLAVIAVLSELMQPGVLSGSFALVFSKVERTYHDPHRNIPGQLCINVFRIGTFALALYLFCYVGGTLSLGHWEVQFLTDKTFLFRKYLLVLLVVFGVDTVKYLLTLWVNYTFQISRRFTLISLHYNSLWTVINSAFYLLLLVLLPVDSPKIIFWSFLALCIVALVLIGVKWLRVFYSGLPSLLYIALYLLTLEVLPLLAMVACAEEVI